MAIRPKLTIDKARTAITLAARKLGRLRATADNLTVLSMPKGDTRALDQFRLIYSELQGLDRDTRSLPWVPMRPIAPGDFLACRSNATGHFPKRAAGQTRFIAPWVDDDEVSKCAAVLSETFGLAVPVEDFLTPEMCLAFGQTVPLVIVVREEVLSAIEARPDIWELHLSAVVSADAEACFVSGSDEFGLVRTMLDKIREQAADQEFSSRDEDCGPGF